MERFIRMKISSLCDLCTLKSYLNVFFKLLGITAMPQSRKLRDLGSLCFGNWIFILNTDYIAKYLIKIISIPFNDIYS